MTSVYVTALEPIGDELFKHLLQSIDSVAREKICRLKRREDQLRSLIAHALTNMMFAKQLKMDVSDLVFTVNEYGKYGVAGNQRHFNISHAGQYAVCALGQNSVGIDIEKREDREYSLFKSVWSFEEKSFYSLEDSQSFYWLWTAKESYIKYLGIGFQADLKSITVQGDGTVVDHGRKSKASVTHIDVHPHYACAVCSEDQIEEINYIGLDLIASFYRRNDNNE